jgi:hypothetical protein
MHSDQESFDDRPRNEVQVFQAGEYLGMQQVPGSRMTGL